MKKSIFRAVCLALVLLLTVAALTGCGASGVCPCVRVGSGFRSAAGSRLFAGSGGAPGAFGFFDVFLFVDFLSHVFLKKNVYVGSGGVRRRSGAG